jgi:gamma-glutamylcyclotransferase (GGCT)/AIG2-like uncharacterized protein YtfP
MLLFFYGTLKSGGSANHLLAGARLIGPVVTAAKYRLYDMGWHPAMVRDDANGAAVEGEVWDVGPELLARLDEYESDPPGFRRQKIEAPDIAGEVQAYVFMLPIPAARPSGSAWPIS